MTVVERDADAAVAVTVNGAAVCVTVTLGLATGHTSLVEFSLPQRDALVFFMQALTQLQQNENDLGAMVAIALEKADG